jgi:hypothetical protein
MREDLASFVPCGWDTVKVKNIRASSDAINLTLDRRIFI